MATSVKTTTSNQNDGTISFELTVPNDTVQKNYAKILARYSQTAEIKGFRKGKAPIALVEAQIDKSRVYSQVIEEVIPPLYSDAIKAGGYAPVIDPQITPIKFEEGKDWVFKVDTAGKPVVDLGDYTKYLAKALKSFKPHAPETAEEAKAHGHEVGHDHSQDEKLTLIFDTLLKEAKVVVSPLIVMNEAKSSLSRLVKQLKDLNLSVADYAKSQKIEEKDLVAEYEKTATTNLKLEFILDKMIEVVKPEVSDEELAKLKPQKGQEAYAKYTLQKQKIVDKLLGL